MQRFYVLLDGEITQSKTEASIRKHMAPHTVEFTHIEWFSKFESSPPHPLPTHNTTPHILTIPTVKERVASTFLHPTPSGPFILAGDAAHVHSVNGGQGMNTGLSDSFNLIWRLHLLLHYPSLHPSLATTLLPSYDTERRATAQSVIDVAAKLVRSTMADAKGYVDLIERNAGFITGMGVQFAGLESPLVRESERGVWTAGHRAPDLWLSECKTGDAVRLYQRLVYGRYVLVLVGAARRNVVVHRPEFLTLLRLERLKAKRIGVENLDEGVGNGVGGAGEDRVEEEVHDDAYGCSWAKEGEEYAVLVRPDCYVQFVGGVDEVVEYVCERLPGLVGVL